MPVYSAPIVLLGRGDMPLLVRLLRHLEQPRGVVDFHGLQIRPAQKLAVESNSESCGNG